MVAREITQIDTDLGVQGSKPCAVIIQPVLQNDQRNRHHAVISRYLKHRAVLQIDPRSGQIQPHITRDDLDIAVELARLPVRGRDINRVRLVLETEINPRLQPFIEVTDRRAAHKPVREPEIVLPPQMVGVEMVQIPVRLFALGIGSCGDLQRIFACHEPCLQLTMHIKLTDLVTQYAHLPLYMIPHVRSAVFVNRAADESVVRPSVIEDTVCSAGHHAADAQRVLQKPLTFVHSKSRDTEFQLRVVCFAESHRDRVPDRQHVRRVIRLTRVVIGRVVEPLVGGFLDIAPVGVVGLENMTECHQRHIFHFDGVFLYPPSVFNHTNRVVILTRIGNRILVVQVAAQIPITDHGIHPNGQIFGTQTAT